MTLKEKFYRAKKGKDDSYVRNILDDIHIIRSGKFDINSILIKIKNFTINSTSYSPTNKQASIPENKTEKTNYLSRILKTVSDFLEFPDREIVWLPFAVVRGFQIIKKNNIDIIFSSSPKHSCHLTTAILKFITRKKLIVEFRDPWARSPWHESERNSGLLERFKHSIIKYFEKFVVKTADKNIFVTDEMKEDFQNHYSFLSQNNFAVFYNGYDPDLRPDNLNTAKTNKESNKIIFSHIGSLYKERNPDQLIFAIKNLIDGNKGLREKILFQFIGTITKDLIFIKQLPAQLKIEDVVHFIPEVDYKQSLEFMLKSDVLILLQPSTTLQLPAKFFDYINMGKAVFAIGEKNSAVENIVDNQFGLFAEYNDIDDIQIGIKRMLKSPNDYKDKGIYPDFPTRI